MTERRVRQQPAGERLGTWRLVAYRPAPDGPWRFQRTADRPSLLALRLAAKGSLVHDLRALSWEAGDPEAPPPVSGSELVRLGWTHDDAAHRWRAPEETVLAPPTRPVRARRFAVTAQPPRDGSLPLALAVGGRGPETVLDHARDPLPDLLAWLEGVAAGRHPRLLLERAPPFLELFTHPARRTEQVRLVAARFDGTPGNRTLLLDVVLDRRTLVDGFYRPLRTLGRSATYDPMAWARLRLADALRQRRPERTPQDLLRASRSNLLRLFREVTIKHGYPSGALFEPGPGGISIFRLAPPKAWDRLPEGRRQRVLTDLLNRPVNLRRGTDLRQFGSETLERWLYAPARPERLRLRRPG